MALRITRETAPDGATVIRVEGDLDRSGVEIVENMCAESAARVVVDVTSLSYLDEPSAAVLRRLRRERGVELRGCCLFNERLIDAGNA